MEDDSSLLVDRLTCGLLLVLHLVGADGGLVIEDIDRGVEAATAIPTWNGSQRAADPRSVGQLLSELFRAPGAPHAG